MRLATTLGLILLLAACGDGGDGLSGADPGTSPPPDLAGHVYTSTSVTGHQLAPGSTVTLTFTDDSISANAGCNTMAGPATWSDGVLKVNGGRLATTSMACEGPLMDQDVWLSEFLTSEPKLSAGGGQLLLEGGGTKLVLEESKPTPLTGTTWKLTGTSNNDAASSLPAGVEASVMIPEGGTTMQVKAGCNTGSVTLAEPPDDSASTRTLEITPGPLTRMMCDDAAMKVEQQVLGVLDGQVTYTINQNQLQLTNGDQGLMFTAS
jgi:heat shock protein HslJ